MSFVEKKEKKKIMSREKIVRELHKTARRNYPRRKVEVVGIDETWQGDLVDMKAYKDYNRGYTFLLTVIDNVSKFAWTVPLKKKSGNELKEAFKKIFKTKRVPKKLHVDFGTEFYNTNVKKLLKDNGVHLYSTYGNMKATIIERFNRTLKTNMWRKFTLNGNYKWVDILKDLTADYNKSFHRTIGVRPIDVNSQNEADIVNRIREQKYYKINENRSTLRRGDVVRISKLKHVFEKGYTANWTTELFTIIRVLPSTPTTYLLKDYNNKPLRGAFYQEELQKTNFPNGYLIERIIKRRGNQAYVKWLGFDDTHNQWVDKNSVF